MPSKTEILRLYKQLLRYGQQLKLTDKAYFRERIVDEFKKNKELNVDQEVEFNFKGDGPLGMISILRFTERFALKRPDCRIPALVRFKQTVDYSLVPKIRECDLEERFVRGSGPGGSAVNKNANCVVLTHKISGIVVKCHISRCLDENRKIARETLISRLDDLQNGDRSVRAQMKAIQEAKSRETQRRKKKLESLKSAWRTREGLE